MIQRRQVLFFVQTENFPAKIREKDDNTFEIEYSNRKRNNFN
mgnify:CR=1 FL=1